MLANQAISGRYSYKDLESYFAGNIPTLMWIVWDVDRLEGDIAAGSKIRSSNGLQTALADCFSIIPDSRP
jgi:hypothetical protein